MKVTSNQFYRNDFIEILKYNNKNLSSVFIINSSSKNVGLFENEIVVSTNESFEEILKKISGFSYDQIFVIDIIESTENIFQLLKGFKKFLNPSGKIIISSINPKWYPLIKFAEFINFKRKSSINSYIYKRKIEPTLAAAGFSIINTYNRQIFPFFLFGVGKFINTILEFLLSFLNLGIKTYFVLQNEGLFETNDKSKSVIVPAKNEAKNLPILFDELEKLHLELEIILIYGKSRDGTEVVCSEIESKYVDNKYIKVKSIQQKTNGKGAAVFEALEISSGDYIAILDSDISVEPKELRTFFEIIENGNVDFVNGTRLITGIESGSMRFLNFYGNKTFQFIINLIISQNISDSLCGTKVFKKENLNYLYSWQNKLKIRDPFGDFDLLLSTSYYGLKIVEYPINYKRRIYGKTQISRFRDGFRLLIYILKTIYINKTSF
jgi:hypothetical protein